jgi:hypothetical protein
VLQYPKDGKHIFTIFAQVFVYVEVDYKRKAVVEWVGMIRR